MIALANYEENIQNRVLNNVHVERTWFFDFFSNLSAANDQNNFCMWVENIGAKEEIAVYEQLLLLPQCFHKLSVADVSAIGKGLSNWL